MNIEQATRTIWNYHLMNHKLSPADMLFVLGHHDLRVPVYVAELYKQGFAPLVVCSGSGTIHKGSPRREQFGDKTEAEVFRDILIREGVPEEVILIENKSQNTGQNYEFTESLMQDKGVELKKVIAVQKPYMERRAYVTGKVWWPDVELLVTSPNIKMEDYPNKIISKEHMINAVVGDLERIIQYPKSGFQIEQEVSQEVLDAFNYLVEQGYTKRMIK
jgi:uncharacterized SAM-binding protein YcdF (DUF218 family)